MMFRFPVTKTLPLVGSKVLHESLLHYVDYGGQKQSKSQEEEQSVCDLSPVVFGDQLPPQKDGSIQCLELLARLQDSSRKDCCRRTEL